MSEWIALHQPYHDGMSYLEVHGRPSFTTRVFPGKPGDPVQVSITDLKLTTHTGTHVDAARHFFPAGPAIDQYPVSRFVGAGVAVDICRSGPEPITAEDLCRHDRLIRLGDIVLLCTGWAEKFGTPDYWLHPYLSQDAADYLVARRVSMVGVDLVAPELPVPLRGPEWDAPIHRTLLGNDILILENLGPGLRQVLGRRITVAACPLLVRNADGAPAAVVCRVDDSQ